MNVKQRQEKETKIVKSIRFTKSELQEIKANMDAYDYLSFSKWVRDVLLHRVKF